MPSFGLSNAQGNISNQWIIIPSATFVALLWGSNFIVINELIPFVGPLNILTIQFMVCWLLLFFVKRPNNLWLVGLWGISAGVLQYGFQNTGLALGVSPGIASVLLQLQAFFTPVLLAIFFKEKLSMATLLVLSIGLLGVFFLSANTSETATSYTIAIILLVLASLSWAFGNIVITKMQKDKVNREMFSVLVYAGAISSIPTIIWASLEEGFIIDKLSSLAADHYLYITALFAWVLTAYFCGYQIWNSLIKRYGGASIVRYSLLVPVFGMLFSHIVYGGQPTINQLMGIGLIMFALVVYRYLEAWKM